MKSFSVVPTDKNALELLRIDPINRNNSVFRFIKLIDAVEGGCSIALNGEWGSGKTIFVKQVKLVMDFKNPHFDRSKTDNLYENASFLDTIPCYESYSTVYYDAWENDRHEDPLLSLIYATIRSNQHLFDANKRRSISDVLGKLLDVITERNVSDFLNQLKGDTPLNVIEQSESVNLLMGEFLDSLITEKGNRLVIFVDELDRCRPSYAVQLLERIKHFFYDERITFVFSINFSQLQHTVKTYYGPFFDATRYLDKFFDLRVAMPSIDYNRFFNYKFSFVQSQYIYDRMCRQVIQYFSFSLREIERYMQMMKIAAYSSTHNTYGPSFSEQKASYFATVYFVPIMIGLNMADLDGYKEFIQGKKPDILFEIIGNVNDYIRYDLLGITNANEVGESEILKEVENKITEIYFTLFSLGGFDMIREKRIGQMLFTENTRNEILETASLLSKYANYDIEI
jgi:hypothetical protein